MYGALASVETPATLEAIELMGRCYNDRLDNCLEYRGEEQHEDWCKRVHAIWESSETTGNELRGYVEGLPWCDELSNGSGAPMSRLGVATASAAGAAAGVVVLGLALAMVRRR